MKKILVLILTCAMVLSFAGCSGGGGVDVFKVGMLLPDAKDAPDMSYYADMIKWAAGECGLEEDDIKIEYGVSKDDKCKEKAEKLSKDGCDVIFAVVDGTHTECIEKAAEKCPADVFMLIASEDEISEKVKYGNVKYAFVNKNAEPEKSQADASSEKEDEKSAASDAQSDSDAKSDDDKKDGYGDLGAYVKKVIEDAKAGKNIGKEWSEPQISSDAEKETASDADKKEDK